MRILFDQETPVPLRHALGGHTVATAFEMGWAGLDNGDLLREAEGRLDLFGTTDQYLRHQQNLASRMLGLLVLPTTSWPEIREHIYGNEAHELILAERFELPGGKAAATASPKKWRKGVAR